VVESEIRVSRRPECGSFGIVVGGAYQVGIHDCLRAGISALSIRSSAPGLLSNDPLDSGFDPSSGFHVYRVEVRGSELKVLIDGFEIATLQDPGFARPGQVGFFNDHTELEVRAFKVQTISAARPISSVSTVLGAVALPASGTPSSGQIESMRGQVLQACKNSVPFELNVVNASLIDSGYAALVVDAVNRGSVSENVFLSAQLSDGDGDLLDMADARASDLYYRTLSRLQGNGVRDNSEHIPPGRSLRVLFLYQLDNRANAFSLVADNWSCPLLRAAS
jgi:hypothetical protein